MFDNFEIVGSWSDIKTYLKETHKKLKSGDIQYLGENGEGLLYGLKENKENKSYA